MMGLPEELLGSRLCVRLSSSVRMKSAEAVRGSGAGIAADAWGGVDALRMATMAGSGAWERQQRQARSSRFMTTFSTPAAHVWTRVKARPVTICHTVSGGPPFFQRTHKHRSIPRSRHSQIHTPSSSHHRFNDLTRASALVFVLHVFHHLRRGNVSVEGTCNARRRSSCGVWLCFSALPTLRRHFPRSASAAPRRCLRKASAAGSAKKAPASVHSSLRATMGGASLTCSMCFPHPL
jgi:hypothetical protein